MVSVYTISDDLYSKIPLKGAKLTFQEIQDNNYIFVGNGELQMRIKEIMNKKRGIGVLMTEKLFDTPSMNHINTDHRFFLQNLPSVIAVHLLNPQPHETVLDMCAAPGGKTTHMASLMKNSGRIIALDKNKSKIQRLRKTAERFGFSNIDVRQQDAAHSRDVFPAEHFDRILLDPPCSALGKDIIIHVLNCSAIRNHNYS
eukprot:gb/GECH01008409.1/.p1 GENE.gb/GECH01008409.1/~~gb/GECH01008409.1/.p1  ORF type:complete len:200 (+),score=47.98 gb/GECH01008409.1/:1-600(+)